MFLHGKSCNETIYRDSEILGRTKSLAKHIRDPDKNGDLFRDSINMDIEESYRRTTQEEYSPKRDKTPLGSDGSCVEGQPLCPSVSTDAEPGESSFRLQRLCQIAFFSAQEDVLK